MNKEFARYDLDDALISRLLAKALGRGGDYADLFLENQVIRTLRWEEGGVKSAGTSLNQGVGIRVLAGDKTGYAYACELDERTLLRAAETASHIAVNGGGVGVAALQGGTLPQHYPIERPAEEVDLNSKVVYLRRIQEAADTADPGVSKVLASFMEYTRKITVANSEGALYRDTQPMTRLGCQVILERDGKREAGSAADGGRVGLEFYDRVTPESLAQESVRMAQVQLEAIDAPAGNMPVILGPGLSGVLLHEAVGHGLEADFIRKRTSKFTDRLGEAVASDLCTIVDDPTIPNDRGAINIDDEGTPVRKTTLIERGVLRSYMHDRISAAQLGVEPTGNGRRDSFRSHPLPRMTCTCLLPGESSVEEIIGSVKKGLYARIVGSGAVDITCGDFTFNINEAYLIEDGKITAPVKGATLVGNGPEVMGRVTMVGEDFTISPAIWTCGKRGQKVPVNHGQPHVKVSEITVGGSSTGRSADER
ncbi:MAG: metalloprotease TldD [bacterium]|nr:metalloprotease TldD [bacterium]